MLHLGPRHLHLGDHGLGGGLAQVLSQGLADRLRLLVQHPAQPLELLHAVPARVGQARLRGLAHPPDGGHRALLPHGGFLRGQGKGQDSWIHRHLELVALIVMARTVGGGAKGHLRQRRQIGGAVGVGLG